MVFHRKAGQYGPDEVAPLSGSHFEMLRGDFCGTGALALSRPVNWELGDWVKIWLPGDADDDPTYLGEIGSEPWWAGRGEVQLTPLTASVSKARWVGYFEKHFHEYLRSAISLCTLPPGIGVSDIAESLALLKADTPHELLGDTMQTAMPVIEGGSWGVDGRGNIGVRRPDDTLKYNFWHTQADTPPGSMDGYANAVRFQEKLPSGDTVWFEALIDDEVAKRGEQWFETQVPASISTASLNPLLGLSAEVVTLIVMGQAKTSLKATKPVFDPDWAGPLADPAPPLRLGSNQAITQPDQSRVRFGLATQYLRGGEPYNAQPVMVLGLPGAGNVSGALPDGSQYNGVVLEMRMIHPVTGEASAWEPLSQATGTRFNDQVQRSDSFGVAFAPRLQTEYVRAGGGATLDIRYAAGYVAAWNAQGTQPLPGIIVHNTAYVQDAYWPDDAVFSRAATITHTAQLGDVNVDLTLTMDLYGGSVKNGDDPGFTFRNSVTPLKESNVPSVAGVEVNLPAPLKLFGGSAFQVKTGDGGVLTLTLNNEVRPLAALENPPAGTLRFGYSGSLMTLNTLTLTGTVGTAGGISAEVADTSILTAYAYGLLRYKVQPVRNWAGKLNGLKRYPASGMARFRTPGGDYDLDVQRVTYDLNGGRVVVEAGTPMANTDADATAEAFARQERENRYAGGKR